MKRTILLMGMILSFIGTTACLENEDPDFVPTIAEQNNSHYGRDGDSIPPPDTDSTGKDTGGEEIQIPIKP